MTSLCALLYAVLHLAGISNNAALVIYLMKSDFLVIGCGIAGLSFALKAANHGKVVIVTKGSMLDSNTAWAQGGISAVLDTERREVGDSVEKHVEDTVGAGAGLCHEDVVQAIVENGNQAIEDLIRSGVEFDQVADDAGQFALGKEGGHSQRRILHHKDTTGLAIASALLEMVKKNEKFTR